MPSTGPRARAGAPSHRTHPLRPRGPPEPLGRWSGATGGGGAGKANPHPTDRAHLGPRPAAGRGSSAQPGPVEGCTHPGPWARGTRRVSDRGWPRDQGEAGGPAAPGARVGRAGRPEGAGRGGARSDGTSGEGHWATPCPPSREAPEPLGAVPPGQAAGRRRAGRLAAHPPLAQGGADPAVPGRGAGGPGSPAVGKDPRQSAEAAPPGSRGNHPRRGSWGGPGRGATAFGAPARPGRSRPPGGRAAAAGGALAAGRRGRFEHRPGAVRVSGKGPGVRQPGDHPAPTAAPARPARPPGRSGPGPRGALRASRAPLWPHERGLHPVAAEAAGGRTRSTVRTGGRFSAKGERVGARRLPAWARRLRRARLARAPGRLAKGQSTGTWATLRRSAGLAGLR